MRISLISGWWIKIQSSPSDKEFHHLITFRGGPEGVGGMAGLAIFLGGMAGFAFFLAGWRDSTFGGMRDLPYFLAGWRDSNFWRDAGLPLFCTKWRDSGLGKCGMRYSSNGKA